MEEKIRSVLFPYTQGDLEILTRTLIGECEGESVEGQQAVAWVIRNRASDPGWWTHYPGPMNTDGRISHIGGACLCRNQFSCWDSLPPSPEDTNHLLEIFDGTLPTPTWQGVNKVWFNKMIAPYDDPKNLRAVAKSVLDGEIPDPTDGSDHYLNPAKCEHVPSWALTPPRKIIGAHRFWKLGRFG